MKISLPLLKLKNIFQHYRQHCQWVQSFSTSITCSPMNQKSTVLLWVHFYSYHSPPLIILPVLHLKYKLKYFKKLGWDDGWIKTAETILKDEFKHLYMDYAPANPSYSATKVCIALIPTISFTYAPSLQHLMIVMTLCSRTRAQSLTPQTLMKMNLKMSWIVTWQHIA